MVRRLGDEGPQSNRFAGPVDFLMPDGEHFKARCDARYTRERWQGVLNLSGFNRGLEQGDVCRLTAERIGELRVVITDKIGSFRYEFIGLIPPDPMETI